MNKTLTYRSLLSSIRLRVIYFIYSIADVTRKVKKKKKKKPTSA